MTQSAKPSEMAMIFKKKISFRRRSRVDNKTRAASNGMNMPRNRTLMIRRLKEGLIAAM